MQTELFESMSRSVIEGESQLAQELAQKALEQGIDPLDAINKGFILGIDHVGEQFGCGEMYLPELVMAGEAMKAALSVLEPEMAKRGTERAVLGKVVLATVEGDIHDIGKTLVGTMLSAAGFQVHDMGVDVPITDVVAKTREVDANVVALSALLTTTMVNQKKVIDQLQQAGLRQQVKVMVGGAPVTRGWADDIGADGYSEDAIGAVAEAKKILGV